jgi:hypothetical protein
MNIKGNRKFLALVCRVEIWLLLQVAEKADRHQFLEHGV